MEKKKNKIKSDYFYVSEKEYIEIQKIILPLIKLKSNQIENNGMDCLCVLEKYK